MRGILLIFSLFAGVANAIYAQQHIPTSWDYPYQEIRKTLYKIEYLDILSEVENEKILCKSNNIFISYFFNHGTLYEIDLTKEFDKLSKAQKAYDSNIDYFLEIGAVPIDCYEDGNLQQIIAVAGSKVYRLRMFRTPENSINVRISAKHVDYAPSAILAWPDEIALDDTAEEAAQH